MKPFVDLRGKRFGRLTPIKRDGTAISPDGSKRTLWLVQCECGEKLLVRYQALVSGNTKSCGCLKKDVSKALGTTHGGSKTRLYRVWAHMVQRCTNPNSSNYPDYGGRGIEICDEWESDFSSFQEWASKTMYDPEAPKSECTIERIDNNKGYSPDNCRWATMKEQCQNRRPKGKNKKPKTKKKVRCIELNTVFSSVEEAIEKTGASQGIRKCCNKIPGYKTSGGYHWEWETK